MQIELSNTRISVAHEGLVALRANTDTRVDSHSGFFWVTEEGSSKDHILGPGESLIVKTGGLTVITALRAGELGFRELPSAPAAALALSGAALLRLWLGRLRQGMAGVVRSDSKPGSSVEALSLGHRGC